VQDDQELVRRCIAGDDRSWDQLVRLYTRRTYNLCYRFTGNVAEAEDLTQEVFLKLFRILNTYDPAQAQFATWLNRITRNHLVDHYRRTSRDRITASLDDEEAGLDPRASPASAPIERLEQSEREDLIQKGLSRLSPEMREVVILRDLQELDYAEIAQIVDAPEGTVKSRLNRGRLELARVLKRMLKTETEKEP
jgi:RNA polymerase sigma-70 factor, ECF subfamily